MTCHFWQQWTYENYLIIYSSSNNNDKSRLDESVAQKSLLGDLPPLGGGGPQLGKNPSLSLAPLKKVPPVAKVEATKKEGQ